MTFLEAKQREYGRAKRMLAIRLWLNVTFLVLGVLSLFLGSRGGAWFTAVLLILPLAMFCIQEIAGRFYSRAESARRSAILVDGLSIKPSRSELAQFYVDLIDTRPTEPSPDGSYYESAFAPGPRRLSDIMAQTAFFTSELAWRSALVFGLVACLGVAFLVAGLVLMIQVGLDPTISGVWARTASVLIIFFAAGDFAKWGLKFLSVHSSMRDMRSSAEQFAAKETPELSDVLILLDRYNCVLATSLPIPTWIYMWKRGALNAAWRTIRNSPVSKD